MVTAKELDNKIDFAIQIDGEFNPEILQPYWLKEKGILKESEMASIDVNILSREITELKSTYYVLRVSSSKFFIETRDIAFLEILIETVRGIFSILGQNKVSAFEFRADVHYHLKTSN